ncbi:MAG: T9SS type A sorting domain-containing protein [Nitritalea sp.]
MSDSLLRLSSLLLMACWVLSFGAAAQNPLLRAEIGPDWVRGGQVFPAAFSGGFNAAQFQFMDVDADGNEEVVLWDINSRQVQVFKETPEGFRFMPEYAYYFPASINGFLVLADYNGDGRKDVFTSSPFGIRAYRNITPAGQAFPEFELAENFLRLENGSNVQANNLDIPLLADIDGDGDLDVITFNFAAGDFLELYLNTSVERTGSPGIDAFAFPVRRWGRFEFCDCARLSFGETCNGLPIARMQLPEALEQVRREGEAERRPGQEDAEGARIEHAGGHSLLYADFNGDGQADLLIGQDACSRLYFLPNAGTQADPDFRSFSHELPGFGPLPEFPIFHAAQLFRGDLLISSNANDLAGIFRADYRQNTFRLLADGGGLTVPFLQSEQLDFGENLRPAWLPKLPGEEGLLTANTLLGNRVVGQAIRVRQREDGSWELLEEDAFGLAALQFTDLQLQRLALPEGGERFFLAGTDTVGFALEKRLFIASDARFSELEELIVPAPGGFSQPLDHYEFFLYEEEVHLLLARQNGELILMRLQETAGGPQLELVENEFLGIRDNPAARNLNVHVLPGERPHLLTSDQRGALFFYPAFMEGTGQREQIPLELLAAARKEPRTRLARNSFLQAYALEEDKWRLFVGTTGGGLLTFSLSGVPNVPLRPERPQLRLFPNPLALRQGQELKLQSSHSGELQLVALQGAVLAEGVSIQAGQTVTWSLPPLAAGMYLIVLQHAGGKSVKKLIVQ